MVGLSAFVSPDNFVIGPKVYESEFKATYSTFGTLSNPAAVTRSMGLPSDAPVVMVFASPSASFYTGSNPRRLSGLSHLDHFILTANSSPLIGTMQKHMPTPTQTATNQTAGPLAFMQRSAPIGTIYL